ncbi:MAG TPA: lyase [Gemmatimonadota bacterium]|nr:lyase [Gemmatimonadota bacterium]
MTNLTRGLVCAVLAAIVGGVACGGDGAGRAEPSRDPAPAEAGSSATAVAVEIDEWKVPWPSTRPRDPYVGPEGRVWFVGQQGDYVGVLNPENGEFDRFDLDPGAGPHNLIVAADGAVWYAGNRAAHIGRLDPVSGEIEKLPLQDPAAADPHTLVFDDAGDIWFTVQGGNRVGHLDTETGEIRIAEVPTPEARPYGIVADGSRGAWFTEFGTNKIGRIDTAMAIEEIVLPRDGSRPRRLEIDGSGAVWYVDFAEGYLGRIDPAGGIREWRTPGGQAARPYGMAMDERGRPWFVETGPSPNRLVGFDPETEEFAWSAEIPSGGGTVRHMYYHAPGRAIWFGTDTGTIGRATLP